MSKETCFYCDDTGIIPSKNGLPEQMCPYCEIGQAVFKGYRQACSIQLGNYDKLKEENEQTLDDLASYIMLCSDLEIENKQLREEIQFLIGGFRVAGWEIKKAECVPIGQMWINSNYDLGV